MRRVVVIGSINIDVIARSARMPLPGETVYGEEVSLLPGGKGANQAVAAARLGVAVTMVGALGSDHFAGISRAFLADEGIDLSRISTTDGATGTAVILVNAQGENSIVIIPGANSSLSVAHLDDLMVTKNDVVLLQNEIPEEINLAAVKRARANGALTVLNLAPYRQTHEELLREVDYLVVNETEFAQLVGLAPHAISINEIAGRLADGAGMVAKTIVTLGPAGLVARLDGAVIAIEGHKLSAVDTTGAGDSFCGAFGAALAMGRDAGAAVKFANAAAALSVQALGASPSMPRLRAVEKLLGPDAQNR